MHIWRAVYLSEFTYIDAFREQQVDLAMHMGDILDGHQARKGSLGALQVGFWEEKSSS